jgi:carbohydrate-selective porin OprB
VLECRRVKGVLVLIACACSTAWADDVGIGPDPSSTYDADDALMGHWRLRKKWLDGGFRIKPTYQWEVFAAPELDDNRTVTAGLALLEVELDFGKLIGGKLGRFYAEGFGIHGGNLTESIGDVYTVSNNAAAPDVRLYEAYVEQPIGPVSIRAGILSADQMFTLASTSVVLLNSTFGIIGITSYNLTNPTYPAGAPGVSVAAKSGPVKTTVTLYDGDNENSHGIPTEIGGEALGFGEVELVETVKLGAWHHTALGSGYYGVLHRQVEKRVGAFARLAVAPDAVGIDFYADAGMRFGFRKKDFFSLGLAYADAESDVGAQTLVEATYQYYVTGFFSIQPDIQLLLDRNGTTTILAMRGTVVL